MPLLVEQNCLISRYGHRAALKKTALLRKWNWYQKAADPFRHTRE